MQGCLETAGGTVSGAGAGAGIDFLMDFLSTFVFALVFPKPNFLLIEAKSAIICFSKKDIFFFAFSMLFSSL